MSEPYAPTAFADVNLALGHFSDRLPALFEGDFHSMCLVGSLALGDFDPSSSDIDFVVVTYAEIAGDRFEQLQDVHTQFAASGSPWARKIEAIYVPTAALSRLVPGAAQYPQIEKGAQLCRAPLESGWIFQCASIRDRGVVLAGADPCALITPIQADEMRAAAAEIAGTWLEQARHDPTWLLWLRQRDSQSFVILTLCRLLYSLGTGSVASKPRAAEWACQELGEPWARLIERVLADRRRAGTIAQSEEDATLAFIRFIYERGGATCPS